MTKNKTIKLNIKDVNYGKPIDLDLIAGPNLEDEDIEELVEKFVKHLSPKPDVKSMSGIEVFKMFFPVFEDEVTIRILNLKVKDGKFHLTIPLNERTCKNKNIKTLDYSKVHDVRKNEDLKNLVKPFVSKKDPRYVFQGVFHDKNGTVATDGKILIFAPGKPSKDTIGKVFPIHKLTAYEKRKIHDKYIEENDNEELATISANKEIYKKENEAMDVTFPDYERVILDSSSITHCYKITDLPKLYAVCTDIIKFYKGTGVTDSKMQIGNRIFDLKTFKTIIEAHIKAGHSKLYFHFNGNSDFTPTVITNSSDASSVEDRTEVLTLLMPMRGEPDIKTVHLPEAYEKIINEKY